MTAPKPKKRRRSQPETSSIGTHVESERIRADLCAGVPVRVVQRKYNVSKDACYRFIKKLPIGIRAKRMADILKPGCDPDKLREEESEGLLISLRFQRIRLLQQQDLAAELADGEMVARMAGHIHRNIELVGKYLGEFVSHSRVQVMSLTMTPDYLRLREALLSAMVQHPEARADMLKALRSIEAAPDAKPTAPVNTPPMIEATAEEREAA